MYYKKHNKQLLNKKRFITGVMIGVQAPTTNIDYYKGDKIKKDLEKMATYMRALQGV